MALDAIAYITDTDVAEGELLLSKPVPECSLTELLVLSIIQNHPECDPFEPTFGQSESPEDNYDLDFKAEITGKGLAICHEESINLDHAIAVTTAVLSVFNLSEMVTINAAFVCDQPRENEFGGASILVTKDTHHYEEGYQFSRLMNDAHDAGVQYALVKVNQYNHENAYTECYLLSCKASESAYDVARHRLASDENTSADPDEDGVIILSEEDNTSMALHSVTELTPVVYDSLSKLLPSLDELCPVTAR
ncbi:MULTISPECIES: hypothetical protein [Escherichia]|uniref:hypothetical protein n=1 Tax=Escherichia TaxID=561 RepID=UPI001EDDF989|nr:MULTISPECIES: hypothetical protein [unclassified Escherichia]MCF7291751.1 hypothetical protein [Escherichia coli]MED0052180.1 hypothetical protein [Escherichia coli]